MRRQRPRDVPARSPAGTGFDAGSGAAYGDRMSGGSNYLDPNRPDAVRLEGRRGTGARRGGARPHRLRRGRCPHRHRPADRQFAVRLPVRRAAAHPRDRARGEDRNARSPVAIVHETPVVGAGRWRQQCRLCRGLSRRRDRDRQGEGRAASRRSASTTAISAAATPIISNASSRPGLSALHTASGAPHIVPPGATRPALGTNPIAFGFPSADGPVIFDIGTASLMWGEVLLAAETGEALPPGLGFDADGNPTTDGRAAAKGGVAAFGGHKGYGLGLRDPGAGIARRRGDPARPGAGLRVSVSRRRSRRDAARQPFAAQMAELVARSRRRRARRGRGDPHPVTACLPRARAPPRRRHPRRSRRHRRAGGAVSPALTDRRGERMPEKSMQGS